MRCRVATTVTLLVGIQYLVASHGVAGTANGQDPSGTVCPSTGDRDLKPRDRARSAAMSDQMPTLPDLRRAASSLFDSKNCSTAAACTARELASKSAAGCGSRSK
jgi:hypothetical protein